MTGADSSHGKVEVLGFGLIRDIFKQNNWPVPLELELDQACPAIELAGKIGLPVDKIEAVFINHKVMPIQEAVVRPGDRVAFIPVGVPGPYRVLLGIKKLPAQE